VNGLQGFQYSSDIEFGPYVAHNIEWHWKGKIQPDDKSNTVNRVGRTYRFQLSDNKEQRWDVQCQLESNRVGLDEFLPVVESNHRAYLKCNLAALDGSGRVASILLRSRNNKPMSGRIGYGQSTMDITGLNNSGLLRSGSKTIGYQIKLQEEIVSAIEVGENRKVWFRPGVDVEIKDLFSATAMALLLHEEIMSYE
jgi:hypothetical protein